MLKKIEIQNFKGIAFASIDLKPITMLFGANSAGKSSVIHAIHYIKEIIERRNFSPRSTRLGGDAVDLGGFKNIVFNHDLKLPIVMSLSIDMEREDLPDSQDTNEKQIMATPYQHFSQGVDSLAISITVEWRESLQQAVATSYSLTVNGDSFAVIEIDTDNPKNIRPFFSHINIKHPLLNDPITDEPIGDFFLTYIGSTEEEVQVFIDGDSVIPDIKDRIIVNDDFGIDGAFDDEELENEITENYSSIIPLFYKAVTGITKHLHDELSKFRYIGPIREVPPRNFEPHFSDEINRWSSGLAAWDLIYGNKLNLDLLNKGLEKLKTGYHFEYRKDRIAISIDDADMLKERSKEKLLDRVKEFYDANDSDLPLIQSGLEFELYKNITEIFDNFHKELISKSSKENLWLVEIDKNISVHLHDIGVGISQIIPVIVAIISLKNPILAIEQPELHIHPKMQVELADIFIEGINKNPDAIYIIETHSEHLMLRFLRRIREAQSSINPIYSLLSDDLCVYFLDQSEKTVDFISIKIDERGRFKNNWPKGFFDERHGELF